MTRRRWIPGLIRVSSTLLSALVFATWVGSALGSASLDRPTSNYTAWVSRGLIHVGYLNRAALPPSQGPCMPYDLPPPPPSWTVWGVRFQYGDALDLPFEWGPSWFKSGRVMWALGVPLWMPLVPLAAVAGVTNTRPWRERRRRRANACVACGYALVGLTPAVACPECGMAHEPRA